MTAANNSAMLRTCKTCQLEKPLTADFFKSFVRSNKIYFENDCKPCRCEKVRQGRAENPDRRAAYNAYKREWKKSNPGKVAIQRKRDTIAKRKTGLSKVEFIAVGAQRKAERLAKKKPMPQVCWLWNNPALSDTQKYRLKHSMCAEFRAREIARSKARKEWIRRATPAWADSRAIVEIYRQAELATDATGVVHRVDHIVPLRGKHVCGLHTQYNMQVITERANQIKRNHFDWGWHSSYPPPR